MEEYLFKKICDILPIAILLVTEEGSVKWANSNFFKLFEIKREDNKFLESILNEIFPPFKKSLLLSKPNLEDKILCIVKKIKFKDRYFLVYTFEQTETLSIYKINENKIDDVFKTLFDQSFITTKSINFEILINNAPLIVIGLGEKSKILIFNDFAEKITGYKRKEILGKEWIKEFIPLHKQEEFYNLWDQIVTSKAISHTYENPIITKNGEQKIIRWHNTVITDRSDKFVMVLSFGEDVTTLRDLEKQRKMILEAIPNPAWLISKDQIIIAQNKAAKRTFGTKEGQYCWEGIWKMRFLSDSKRRFYKATGHPLPGTKCVFCKADMALKTAKNIKSEVQLEDKTWETWWLPVKEDLYVYYASDITEHKKIQEEFYKLSIIDTLTGAYNRRYFLKKIKEELERVKRGGLPFSLALFDIDRFKLVNDTYGHQTGDLVLKELVDLVSSRIRKIDLLARWGGEEFILLLVNTWLHQAVTLTEELRELIESYTFKKVKHITVSFGVTQCLKEDSIDSIISRADNLMYQAKKSGRNCVKFG